MSAEKTGTYSAATLPEEKVLEQFGTSLSKGLSSRTAEERLASAGPNAISAGRVPWWEIAIRQFRSAFICLLTFLSKRKKNRWYRRVRIRESKSPLPGFSTFLHDRRLRMRGEFGGS